MRISKAQALQRTGRAGRESSGTCYRIYTEEEFDSLKKNTVPEILRYLTIKKKKAKIFWKFGIAFMPSPHKSNEELNFTSVHMYICPCLCPTCVLFPFNNLSSL